MRAYSLDQYISDLVFGVLMAGGFTLIAAVPLLIAGILNIVNAFGDRPLEVPWGAYALMWLVVPGSYLAAALSGSTAAFLLRPLRSTILGWCATGALVAVCVYGSVGLAMAVFHDPVGAIFLENATREEAWKLIPFVCLLLAPVGAVVGGYMGWRDRRGDPVW